MLWSRDLRRNRRFGRKGFCMSVLDGLLSGSGFGCVFDGFLDIGGFGLGDSVLRLQGWSGLD